ncbi:hypothetical protein [Caulobacter sp. LARHSG274]
MAYIALCQTNKEQLRINTDAIASLSTKQGATCIHTVGGAVFYVVETMDAIVAEAEIAARSAAAGGRVTVGSKA